MHALIQSARVACTQASLGGHVLGTVHKIEIVQLRHPISRLYNGRAAAKGL